MHRSVLALALFVPTLASAQAVTRPVVAVSAGYLRNTGFYDADGGTMQTETRIPSAALRLAVEAPVARLGAATVSAGARFALSQFQYSGNRLRAQNLDLYGRIGTPDASARVGVALDLGRSAYDGPGYNTDGQSAVVVDLRGERPAGPVVVFARADAALTLPMHVDAAGFDDAGNAIPVRLDQGDLYSAQAGAAIRLGPVRLGLAAYYTARGDFSVTYVGTPPPGEPASTSGPAEQGTSYGLIPSVEVRPPGGHVLLRVEGAYSDYLLTEGVPLGITLGGTRSVVVRRVATASLSVQI